MTVMCELHSMLKELKAAADRASSGELWASVIASEAAPLPPTMLMESIGEPELQDGTARKSPKKSGKGTLRSISSTGVSGIFSNSRAAKGSSNTGETTQGQDKSLETAGLGRPIAGEPPDASSLEDSPPPPPPAESGSHSDSSAPPPPPPSDSGANSTASSPIPPPPQDLEDSPIPPPPALEPTGAAPVSSVSTSTEPADAATYISATMARDRDAKAKKKAAAAQTTASTASTTTTAIAKPTQAVVPPSAALAAPTPSIPSMSSAKKTATPAPKLVVHELPLTFIKIVKDSIDGTPPMDTSALSKLLGPTDVDVWLPDAKSTVSVRVLPTATMQVLVTNSLKVYNQQRKANGEKLLETHPDAYNVRIATPDGQVDDLFPILAKKGTVDQWAEVAFILVENPNFKPGEAASAANKSDSLEKGSATASPSTASGAAATPSAAEKVTIRVMLPNGAYHTLLAETSMKLSKLLALICEKRKMISTHYTLTTLEREYLSPNMRIQDLKELQLVLESKSDGNVLGPPSAEEIFYNDNVAAQYKLFQNVTFHIKNKKRFGNSKQEPISLGIDGTKLEISFPKRTQNATFAYAISDLKSVQHMDDNPLFITIETVKEREKLVFEVTSNALALEITTKVSILIEQIASKEASGASTSKAQ